MRTRIIVLLVCLWLVASTGWAQQKQAAAGSPAATPLRQGVTLQSSLAVAGGDAARRSFSFEVSDETLLVELIISNSPADLDLFVFDAAGERVAAAERYLYNEQLTLSRTSTPRLNSGRYTVEVAYQYPNPPLVGGNRLTEIPFEITARYVIPQVERTLRPGDQVSATLRPDSGMLRLYRIEVPTGTIALRLDVSNTDGDVDLFANPGPIALVPTDNAFSETSVRGTEVLILDRDSDPPLRPGTYGVMVIDQVGRDYPVDFSLIVSASREAPEALRSLPPITIPTEPSARALLATVEIAGYTSGGSGVIIDERGFLLTNWHVVQGNSGGVERELTVAFSLDHARPPRELFLAEVIEFDSERDLALLRISAGRYGQPLPAGIRFPAVALADDLPAIGSPLRLIGFPSAGGTQSRVSITLSGGLVAGFERTPFGAFIKTDAAINEGNSGGAALNAAHELVGLPTKLMERDGKKIGFIVPVTAVPADWLRHLR